MHLHFHQRNTYDTYGSKAQNECKICGYRVLKEPITKKFVHCKPLINVQHFLENVTQVVGAQIWHKCASLIDPFCKIIEKLFNENPCN